MCPAVGGARNIPLSQILIVSYRISIEIMPELPEVESIKKYLAPLYVGKSVLKIEVMNLKQISGNLNLVKNKKVEKFGRHGKVMLIEIEGGASIQIHLKMSGRISHWPTIHTRAKIHFTDADPLYFNDPRKFGWLKVDKKLHTSKGIDCLDINFTLEYFRQIIERSKKNIKTLLLDQSIIAGIGNIYANDALWESKISPKRTANSLTPDEIKNLYESILKVINDGILRGGSSKTYVYRLPDGTKGHYQDHFRVYNREDKPCKKCETLIIKFSQNGRSTWSCQKCQV